MIIGPVSLFRYRSLQKSQSERAMEWLADSTAEVPPQRQYYVGGFHSLGYNLHAESENPIGHSVASRKTSWIYEASQGSRSDSIYHSH